MDPWYLRVVERDVVPDQVLAAAIRTRIARRVAKEGAGTEEQRSERFRRLVQRLREAPIAVATDAANEQHYELPPEFFELILGPRRKYSSAYWPPGVTSLGEAEDAMLELYAERADLRDGQRVLELGLRLGLALAVAGRAPPGLDRRRGVELPRPAPLHRGRGRAPGPHQPRDRHRRRERPSPLTARSTGS